MFASSSSNNIMDDIFSAPVATRVQARWERKSATEVESSAPAAAQCRFIPNRNSMNRDLQMHFAANGDMCVAGESENYEPEATSSSEEATGFADHLAESLFHGQSLDTKVLAFSSKAPKPSEAHQNNLRVLYTENKERVHVRRATRHIASNAERVLDAPQLLNDFYLNLLSWSSSNVLAVALGNAMYLWNATTAETSCLMELEEENNYITSVSWSATGDFLSIGTAFGEVQLWDTKAARCVRKLVGHEARVSSLSWNGAILSTGGRDSRLINHDVRERQSVVSTYQAHEQEICGLAWSPDGNTLASGGNDNLCCLWDARNSTPEVGPRAILREHTAAVKALAWCPWQANTLATGAGTADRHIRFYNTASAQMINSIDTQSQVCSLVWSPHEKELLSSHGFSKNQLSVWKFPSMAKIADLTGHQARVLHTAISADGTTVCSAAADETIRFWRVWDAPSKPVDAATASVGTRVSLRAKIGGAASAARVNIR